MGTLRKVEYWQNAVDGASEWLTSKDANDQMLELYKSHVAWCEGHLYKAKAKYVDSIGRDK